MNQGKNTKNITFESESDTCTMNHAHADTKQDENILQQLKLKSPNLLIITGMGMTMQTAQKFDVPMDMHWLVERLFEASGLTRLENENRHDALERWLRTILYPRQQSVLQQVLHTELPVQNLTTWLKLIEVGRPIITQSIDLHAAIAMYQYVYKCAPKKIDDLNDVILTWESSIGDLELFFQGRLRKILYREGCFLTKNYLLGKKNYSVGSKSLSMKFINQMMRQLPILLVGTLAAVRTAPLKSKLHDIAIKKQTQSDIFRIVQSQTTSVPFVNDILCDNYQESFGKVLTQVCNILKSS